jgi:hypothetical protein
MELFLHAVWNMTVNNNSPEKAQPYPNGKDCKVSKTRNQCTMPGERKMAAIKKRQRFIVVAS